MVRRFDFKENAAKSSAWVMVSSQQKVVFFLFCSFLRIMGSHEREVTGGGS